MKKHALTLFICSLFAAAFLFADNPHVPRGSTIVADVTVPNDFGQNGNLVLPPGGSYTAYVIVEQL